MGEIGERSSISNKTGLMVLCNVNSVTKITKGLMEALFLTPIHSGLELLILS